jgi:hypothetical protein
MLKKVRQQPSLAVLIAITVLALIGIAATVWLWNAPTKAQSVTGLLTLFGNLVLIGVTWVYVPANQELVAANKRQQEMIFPKLVAHIDSVKKTIQKVTRNNVDMNQGYIVAFVTISNTSPFTNDTVWVESVISSSPALKSEGHYFGKSGERLAADTVTLSSGEAKVSLLRAYFSCPLDEASQAEDAIVTFKLRDAFGQPIELELTMPRLLSLPNS